MPTPKVFIKRLLKLADYLKQKVAPAVAAGKVEWNMKQWATVRPGRKLNCGTAACAAGYATNIFRELTLEDNGYVLVVKEKETDKTGFDACRSFFGSEVPFDPYAYPNTKPSISEVIQRIRKEAAAMVST